MALFMWAFLKIFCSYFSIMGTLSISVVLDLLLFTNYNPHYGHPWDTLDSIRAVSAVINSSHVEKTTVPFSNAGRQLFAVTRRMRQLCLWRVFETLECLCLLLILVVLTSNRGLHSDLHHQYGHLQRMRTTLTFKCFRNMNLVETFHFMSIVQCNVILRCFSEEVSATTCKTCIRDVTGSRFSSDIRANNPAFNTSNITFESLWIHYSPHQFWRKKPLQLI